VEAPIPQASWIEVKRAAAQARISESVSTARDAASQATVTAGATAKVQAAELTVGLTLIAPLVILLVIALACTHMNVLVIAKLVPVCLLGFVGYLALSLFNPGTGRN